MLGCSNIVVVIASFTTSKVSPPFCPCPPVPIGWRSDWKGRRYAVQVCCRHAGQVPRYRARLAEGRGTSEPERGPASGDQDGVKTQRGRGDTSRAQGMVVRLPSRPGMAPALVRAHRAV